LFVTDTPSSVTRCSRERHGFVLILTLLVHSCYSLTAPLCTVLSHLQIQADVLLLAQRWPPCLYVRLLVLKTKTTRSVEPLVDSGGFRIWFNASHWPPPSRPVVLFGE